MSPLNVEELISKLTIDEKISLLSGRDHWHTKAVPRLGIPSIRVSDGPNGIRGTRFFNGTPAACFPCGTGLGATWDTELIRIGGQLMGQEAIAKGASVILGPTVNIQRSPLGGRGFESFSEDPFLSGSIAAATISGIQSTGVAATIKHFVCNDQEHERQAADSIVSERALREIYLMPFQIAFRDAKPWAIMTAYNKVNGTHVSESPRLIEGVLRQEWGFDGLTISDWYGTYSTTESIKAGLDLEMPGPGNLRGEQVPLAITCRKLSERIIDERIRNSLNFINKVSTSGIQENAPEKGENTAETAKILRDVASASIVLLKNENKVLPLDKNKTIAVIGPNAKFVAISGGGSAALRPYYAVTPYDGIKAYVPDIKYTLGSVGYKYVPLLSHITTTHDEKPGFTVKTYAQPASDPNRKPIQELHVESSELVLVDYEPPGINDDLFYMDVEATLSPDEDSDYQFGLTVCGTAKLFLDGELVLDNSANQRPGEAFFGAGTLEERATKYLHASKTYNVLLQFGSAPTSPMRTPGVPPMRGGGFRLGGTPTTHAATAIEKAVTLAREVDQVVIITGLNADWESEGYDRSDMALPGTSDALIAAISASNPRTVVVLQSGTPVSMPWCGAVPAVLQAWYGGNESGNAIADVLFGATNPSGKLPLSFPLRNEDNPAFLNMRSERGRVLYGEGVYVGYRYYEMVWREVRFGFGHGLSYTLFEMRDLRVWVEVGIGAGAGAGAGIEEARVKVAVEVRNVGPVAGAEVVQVYVSQRAASINRPKKELKGFRKVVLQPGESKVVEVGMEVKNAASFWDEDRDMWLMEKGLFDVLVGNSSVNTPLKGDFEVKTTRWWSGL